MKVSYAAQKVTGLETHFQIFNFSSCFLWYIPPFEPSIINQNIHKNSGNVFNLVFFKYSENCIYLYLNLTRNFVITVRY